MWPSQNIWTLPIGNCLFLIGSKIRKNVWWSSQWNQNYCNYRIKTNLRKKQKQKQDLTYKKQTNMSKKKSTNFLYKSCWMSNIWNSIWTFVKSDIFFFFFSVKALLNLILEWKKGRKFTILCQGNGELKIYRLTARKWLIWVSIRDPEGSTN